MQNKIIVNHRVMKRRMEFSKKIFVGISIMTGIIVAFTLFMVYVTRDMSPLMYLIPAAFAELAAATGFYYRKAQAENVEKIHQNGGDQF